MAFDLRDLRGVGPKLEAALNQLGIQTCEDLLFHLPYRYEDRTRIQAIGSLYPGARVLVEGEVGLEDAELVVLEGGADPLLAGRLPADVVTI